MQATSVSSDALHSLPSTSLLFLFDHFVSRSSTASEILRPIAFAVLINDEFEAVGRLNRQSAGFAPRRTFCT